LAKSRVLGAVGAIEMLKTDAMAQFTQLWRCSSCNVAYRFSIKKLEGVIDRTFSCKQCKAEVQIRGVPRPILRSQANEVFKRIEQAELDPSDFTWEMRGGKYPNSTYLVSCLVHLPTWFFFEFDFYLWNGDWTRRYSQFQPGGADSLPQQSYDDTWEEQLATCEQWISIVAREVKAPALWNEIRKAGTLLSPIGVKGEAENKPFSKSETEQIRASLARIEKEMQKIITTEQFNELRSRLAWLEVAASRMGRKDWILLALGSLVSFATGAVLTPSTASKLFQIAGDALSWMFLPTLLAP
jgi:hypothetical protein